MHRLLIAFVCLVLLSSAASMPAAARLRPVASASPAVTASPERSQIPAPDTRDRAGGYKCYGHGHYAETAPAPRMAASPQRSSLAPARNKAADHGPGFMPTGLLRPPIG